MPSKGLIGTIGIYLDDGETQRYVASLLSARLSVQTNMLPALHPDLYGWDYFIPGMQGWRVDASVMQLVDTDTSEREMYLQMIEQACLSKTPLSLIFDAPDTDLLGSEGYIDTFELGGSFEDGFRGSFGIQGIGELKRIIDWGRFGTIYAQYTPDTVVEDPSNPGQVLRWEDASGLNHHLIQNVGVPLLSDINGRRAVSIVGTTHRMRSASSFAGTGTGTHHCFIVGFTTETVGDIFDTSWADGYGAYRILAYTVNLIHNHAGQSVLASPPINLSTQGPFLVDYRKEFSHSDAALYFNGTLVGEGNIVGGPHGALQIGRWVTNNGPIAKYALILLYGEDANGDLPDPAPIRAAILEYFGIGS